MGFFFDLDSLGVRTNLLWYKRRLAGGYIGFRVFIIMSYIIYGLAILISCVGSLLAIDSHLHEFKHDPHKFEHDPHKFVHEPHVPNKKSVKCYQCAYSPPRTVEEEVKVPVQDTYGNIYYKTKIVKTQKVGGWDKCQGPFDNNLAIKFGIDVWECDANCYTRTDEYSNVYRGCWKGEFGVDPNKIGCHIQAGSLYCFCYGDKCNNQAAVDFPKNKDDLTRL